MKKKFVLTSLCLLALIICAAACLQKQQKTLSGKMIRLHVVANSDSQQDQQIKLRVRDAVLGCTQSLLDGTDDPGSALGAGISEIESAARSELLRCGCRMPVTVSLANERFPSREYDTFHLPAGIYRALRVTIGEGKGHNWWCVVYPSICLTAGMDELELAAQTAGFTKSEIRLITGESEPYVIKFKVLEWLDRLKRELDSVTQRK